MEILAVLLVLTFLDNNSEMIQKLRSMLEFYRQNRELIAMFQSTVNRQAPAHEPPAPEEEKESRPAGAVDSMKILEEYLKRSAV